VSTEVLISTLSTAREAGSGLANGVISPRDPASGLPPGKR
jgi:hypothetical protein